MMDHPRPDAAEWAALFSAGALLPDEERQLEELRAAGWPEFEAELKKLDRTVGFLADLCLPSPPPGKLRDRVLESITAPTHDLFIQRDDPGVWQDTPFPGIRIRILHADQVANRLTTCVRMEPGAKYPEHPHDIVEECLVLEGELRVGHLLLKPGDYQRAEPGSHHAEQSTTTGALLLLTLPYGTLAALTSATAS